VSGLARERLGRIAKLRSLREHALERARSAFAEAEREARARRESALAEREGWRELAEIACALREGNVDDFVLARDAVLAARARVEARERELAAALSQLEHRGAALTEAHRGVRQMELYEESTRAVLREEERRLDRTASDELATRARRTRP
jgi:hypothetical protein